MVIIPSVQIQEIALCLNACINLLPLADIMYHDMTPYAESDLIPRYDPLCWEWPNT